MSAQGSWDLIVSVPPSITAKPYAMCVQSVQSMSSGMYLPIPGLQEEGEFRNWRILKDMRHIKKEVREHNYLSLYRDIIVCDTYHSSLPDAITCHMSSRSAESATLIQASWQEVATDSSKLK